MPAPPIAIVGAGLSGLTLGLCLRSKGIAAVIYDRAPSLPPNNYGITLHSSTIRLLSGLLCTDETTLWSRLAVDAQQDGSGSLGTKRPNAFRCHRGRLEALLSNGLSISWDKELEYVKLEALSKEITAVFEDGSTLNTRCLVGCDGPHSMTRQSLSSAMKLHVLPYVVFNGKRRISNAEYIEEIHQYMQDSVLIQTQKRDARLELSINDLTGSHVDVSYTYSRPARASHHSLGSDPLHSPGRPVSGATKIPEDFYTELAALRDVEPPFDEMFDVGKL